MSEQRPRLLRNHGGFVIRSGERTYRCEILEHHQGDEFNFRAPLAAQQLDTLEPANVPVLNPDEDLLLQQRLIGIGVARRGPSVPDPGNHVSPFSFLDNDSAEPIRAGRHIAGARSGRSRLRLWGRPSKGVAHRWCNASPRNCLDATFFPAGLIFWFMRKRLPESYLRFTL